MFFRQAATWWTSRLYSFEFLSPFDTSADFIDYFSECSSHRYFDQADIVNLSCEGEHFGSFGTFCSDCGKPLGTFGQNNGNVGKRFYIIYVGGFTQITGFGGEGRF